MLMNVLAVGLRRGARGPLNRKPSIWRAESWGWGVRGCLNPLLPKQRLPVPWGRRSLSGFRREAVFNVCQAKLARPGREQPKLGRSALKGAQVRV